MVNRCIEDNYNMIVVHYVIINIVYVYNIQHVNKHKVTICVCNQYDVYMITLMSYTCCYLSKMILLFFLYERNNNCLKAKRVNRIC